jgi:DtxR family Mn-dependent transcriptional regulator
LLARLLLPWRARRAASRRTRLEDALKHLHAAETRHAAATAESIAGVLGCSLRRSLGLVAEMEAAGLAELAGATVRLTARGRLEARRIVRAHRLLERRLVDELGVPLAAVHDAADRDEHRLSAEGAATLETRLGYPRRDPHGDPIPSARGSLAHDETTPLSSWQLGRPGRIVHLEDEPQELLAQALAAGLRPGMQIVVLESGPHELRLWDGEGSRVLSRLAAVAVDVAPLPHAPRAPLRLSSLSTGETARIAGLDCEGPARRRLLDLGMTVGTPVECCFAAPAGEPRAYRVRNAVIALRRAQAEQIRVERLADERGEPA